MKLIFLDFDGVLNSRHYFRSNRGKSGGPAGEAGALSKALVAKLNRVISETGAEVVVSSSWRYGRTVERLAEILKSRGFRGVVRDKTADWSTEPDAYSTCERGDEIRAWLDAHCPDATFVVLDDNADMTAVRERFVQTDFDTGLTDEHVERCIAMLGSP